MRPAPEHSGPQIAQERQESGETMGRREFLALSSSCAMVPWLGGLATVAAQPLAPVRATTSLSVGYLEGSDLFSSFDVAPWEKVDANGEDVESALLDVYPAVELPAGDPSFGWESAEVTVFGLYPPLAENEKQHILRAALEVTYRIEDPTVEAPLSFLAWAYSRNPVANAGCGIRFVAPVDRDRGLSLVLHVEDLRPRYARRPPFPPARSLRADFTVNLESGRPKLRRGVYLLGLRPGMFDRPLSLSAGEAAQAANEALVLAIDHADPDRG